MKIAVSSIRESPNKLSPPHILTITSEAVIIVGKNISIIPKISPIHEIKHFVITITN